MTMGKLGARGGFGSLGAHGGIGIRRLLVGNTDFAVPDNLINDTTSNSLNSRKICYAPANSAMLDVVLAFPGFGENNPEANFPVTYTVNSAAVEYPIGTITQVFFKGSPSVTVTPGSVLQESDPLPITIPAGAQFAVKCNVTWAAGNFWLTTWSASHLLNSWTTRGTNLVNHTLDTIAQATTSAQAGFAPIIYSKLASQVACVGLIGDSDGNATGDWTDTTIGYNSWGRALRGAIPFINLARGGASYSGYFTRHSGLDLVLNGAITHLIMEMGSNTLFGGASSATLQANLQTAIAPYLAAGVKCYAVTFGPRTTSTDGWISTANQTITNAAAETVRVAYNAWLRANYASIGLSGYFDLARAADPTDSGKWQFDAGLTNSGNSAAGGAVLSGGAVASMAPWAYNNAITSAGSGYALSTTVPCVVYNYPNTPGSGAVVHGNTDGTGKVTSYTVDTAGSGYTYPPMVTPVGPFTSDGVHFVPRGFQEFIKLSGLAPELFVAPAVPSWVPNPLNQPDIAVNWTTSQVWLKSTGLTTLAALGVVTSRASVKQVVNSLGNWSQVAANVTAISDLGRSTEEARTNSIRNNTMQGAVAGSPGTLPTNWAATSNAGLTKTIVGTGTINGIDYIDIQWSGTSTSTAIQQKFDATTQIAAAYGQTWSHSVFLALVGGDLTNVTNCFTGFEADTSGGTFVSQFVTGDIRASLTGTLQRFSISGTPLGSTTGNVTDFVQFAINNASAVNFTLRIGWPQLENNNINSTVASAVKAADGTGGVNGTGVYSVAGTGTLATLNCTWAAGVLTINSVASAGSYTAFPAAGAALTYVSGTATGWTGATVNATPTNLAANAFATSPIKTTAGAATRASDLTSLSGQNFGASYSLFERFTPQAPASWGNNQEILCLSDGSLTNILRMYRQNGTGNPITNLVGGTGGGFNVSGNLAQNSQSKFAFALASGSQSASVNGGTVGTGSAATLPPGVNQVTFGAQPNGVLQMNGLAAIDAIWTAQAVAGSELQSMTT